MSKDGATATLSKQSLAVNAINYHNKKFSPVRNSDNGEVSSAVIFHYQQHGNILTCNYSGGQILSGHLIGKVDQNGCIDMRYHQINDQHILMTGICQSIPEIMENGKIKLRETWQWTSGDQSAGFSTLEEL